MRRADIVQAKEMTAQEAAELISHGEIIGTSGFTPAGYPKDIPRALAEKAKRLHEAGEDFKISLYTGASVGEELDGALADANAISKRLPYQSNKKIRQGINSIVPFTDRLLDALELGRIERGVGIRPGRVRRA